jgi:KDO2-lipid IV(A) lauroyltransferase
MNDWIEFHLFFLLYRLASRMSYGFATTVGRILGHAVYSLTGLRKRVTLENLRNAFPEKGERELRGIARAAYVNYGIAITHMLWSGGAPAEDLETKVHEESLEPVRNALAQGKGLVLLSAHFGCWELLVSSLRLRIGVPFVIVVQNQRNRRINALLDQLRSRFENQTVPMGPSVRVVLKALKENKVIALLGDQSGPKEAVFVDFFGRPAATHRGPALFSLRYNTPLLMVFLLREADGTYRALFEEVDRTGLNGASEENVLELTRRHTAVLEKYVRSHPDQWLWMHRRWKHTAYYEAHHLPAIPAGEEV